MKKILFLMSLIISLFLFDINVYAECNSSDIAKIKNMLKKVIIAYKHIEPYTNEKGERVYDEFLVTAKNIPDDVYIHLYPMTDENFEESTEGLKIKLSTGNWTFDFYSSKCDSILNAVEVKLPRFNLYSLDPLCDGISEDEFKLCGKYYEYDVSREEFERRVLEYKRSHSSVEEVEKDANINIDIVFNKVIDFIKKYYVYFIVILFGILIASILISYSYKKKKRRILQ